MCLLQSRPLNFIYVYLVLIPQKYCKLCTMCFWCKWDIYLPGFIGINWKMPPNALTWTLNCTFLLVWCKDFLIVSNSLAELQAAGDNSAASYYYSWECQPESDSILFWFTSLVLSPQRPDLSLQQSDLWAVCFPYITALLWGEYCCNANTLLGKKKLSAGLILLKALPKERHTCM